MRNPQLIKLFLITAACTAVVISFSYIGTAAYGMVFSGDDAFASGTFVGNEDVSGMDKSQALSYLAKKQEQWINGTEISLKFQEVTEELKPVSAIFKFDLQKSIELAASDKKNQVIAEMDEEKLSAVIEGMLPDFYAEGFDIEMLKADLLMYASLLEQGSHIIKLQNYISGELLEEEVIAESSVKLTGKESLIENWAGKASIEVPPQSQISFLELAEERGSLNFKAEEISVISSALYKTILDTNFMITERHIGRLLPGYTEPGYEARVDPGKQIDFIFTNPNDHKYLIEFQQLDNLLYVAVKGPKPVYKYQSSVRDKQTFKPKTIIQIDAKLPFGQKRTGVEGKEGILVNIYRDQIDEAGQIINSEKLAEDFYPPVHEVLIYSLAFQKDNVTNNDEGLPEDSAVIENGETQSGEAKDTSEQNTIDKQKDDGSKDSSSKQEEKNGGLWGLEDEAVK